MLLTYDFHVYNIVSVVGIELSLIEEASSLMVIRET